MTSTAARARDRVGVRGDGVGQRERRHGEADDVGAVEREAVGGRDADGLRQRDAGQVALVDARRREVARLLRGAAAELDLEAGARERDGEPGPPRPGADDRGAPQRRGAAEPLPLQLDARPDALDDRHARSAATAPRRCGNSSGCRRAGGPCAGGCASRCGWPRCR